MKRPNCLKAAIAVIAVLSLGFSELEPRWSKVSTGIREAEIKKIFINPESDGFWMATTRSAYQVQQVKGRYNFEPLSGHVNATINDILTDEHTVYLATNDGLYARGLRDYHFKRIFYSSDEHERQCLSIAAVSGKLLLGTRHGLFMKDKNDVSWQAMGGELSDALISQIAIYGNAAYALNTEAVFRIDPVKNSYTKIFTVGLSREGEGDPDEEETAQTVESTLIDLRSADLKTFYLATQKGVYVSHDSGQNWRSLTDEGLPLNELRRLLIGKGEGELLAATARGVYRYSKNRWEQMYQGLESNNVFDLAQDNEGNIYAATDRGLFMIRPSLFQKGPDRPERSEGFPPSKFPFKNYADIELHFDFEPTIRDVQAMAIEYAEVHPDKIKKWRKQAQMKAMAPSLSTGVNRSATDKFHWDTGPNPDALQKGREYLDWDVGLSWDLGELIWNNDQTSIDSRSKLMVELREDVLDQVTRIYFERRRIQVDLINRPDIEPIEKIEQQMRLAELTAIIDGFTGGNFSKRMGKLEVGS
jgi:hypothetical protein